MPTFEHACAHCGTQFDDLRPMSESANMAKCPECGTMAGRSYSRSSAPTVRGDIHSWSNENNGKGRRISQLDHGVRAPFYAKSQQAAIDEASRRGLTAIKAR